MTPAARLRRYLSVWARLHRLRQLDLGRHSLEELVDRVFEFGGGFFEPIQIKSEIIEALREVRQLRPRYLVEIGTAGGGTLLLWSRVADPEATIVTIDLPGGEFGGGSSALRVPLFRRLPLPGQTLHVVRGDSHDPRTVELTRAHLRGHPADFLFIDADHTESGVRADYAMYSPLVRPGGTIGFHDIAITRPEYGVRTLWSELRARYRTREILGHPHAFGIGFVYLEGGDGGGRLPTTPVAE
jgi:predicted O-methyltransferase YrrM